MAVFGRGLSLVRGGTVPTPYPKLIGTDNDVFARRKAGVLDWSSDVCGTLIGNGQNVQLENSDPCLCEKKTLYASVDSTCSMLWVKGNLTLSQTSPVLLYICNASHLKTLWEKEKFLLFPHCFLSVLRPFCHFHQVQNCPLQTLLVWKSLKFVICERVNAFFESTDPYQPEQTVQADRCFFVK